MLTLFFYGDELNPPTPHPQQIMNRINPDIDIIIYILDTVLKARPEDSFCKSLRQQYIERGGLSKKQLEGLYGKAQKVEGVHPGRLATLEAIIRKKHTTHRSQATITAEMPGKDEAAGQMIEEILARYPQHKGLLLLKATYKKQDLSAAQKDELQRFYKLLMKKPAP